VFVGGCMVCVCVCGVCSVCVCVCVVFVWCVCVCVCVFVKMIAKTHSRRTDGFYCLRGHLTAEGEATICSTAHVELQLKTEVLWNVTP